MKQTLLHTKLMYTFLPLVLIQAMFFKTSMADSNIKSEIGADAYVRGYSTKKSTKSRGFSQLLRVKLNLEKEKSIKLKTRTILSGDNWKGDSAEQAVTGNSDNGSGGNPVRLDYGYIEANLPESVVMRAGRTTANFSDCFNTCDDRRDRLLLMKSYGKYLPVVLYDKRVEGSLTNQEDDRDMYGFAVFHLDKKHEWAILYANWQSDNNLDLLDKVHNFSPYYKYRSSKVTALAVYNWLGQGSRDSIFHGHHHSFALKAEYLINPKFDVSIQGIFSINGGLIASGYDTYSFVVNNDPDHNRSNSRLVSLGGLGTLTGDDRDNEHFVVSRFRYLNQKHKIALSVGKAREYVNPTEYDLMIYDLQYSYQYTKSLLFKSGLAIVRKDRQEKASIMQIETTF